MCQGKKVLFIAHCEDKENVVFSLSAHKLGLTLPEESKAKWDKRDLYDGIVLLDWESTTENFYQSKLHRLRVTMTEVNFQFLCFSFRLICVVTVGS